MPPLETFLISRFMVFTLVLARIGALVMTAPLFGSQALPRRVRALLAVAMSLLVTPVYLGATLPPVEQLVDYGRLLVNEALVGLLLGLGMNILFSGIQVAGQVVSQMSGLSLADVVNPTFDTPVPIFSQLLEMLALAIFFLLGGHRHVIDALLGSFAWMPPGAGRLPEQLPEMLSTVAGHSFETGIRASAPVMVALLLAILIVALISRTLPQLNAIAIGLNFNAMVVLAVLAFCLGSAAFVFQDEAAGVVELVRETFLAESG
jgi:flagellar biosynthetic protein FliR